MKLRQEQTMILTMLALLLSACSSDLPEPPVILTQEPVIPASETIPAPSSATAEPPETPEPMIPMADTVVPAQETVPPATTAPTQATTATISARPTAAESSPSLQEAALRPQDRSDLATLGPAPYYTISATVDLRRATVQAELTLRYTNRTGVALSELVLRLFPNARAIYGGGGLSVERVTRRDALVKFTLSGDRTVLHVPLSPSLEPNAATTLLIQFRDQIPVQTSQGYGIFNQSEGVTWLAGWYPIVAVYNRGWQAPRIPLVGDALFAESSLYDVRITAPAGPSVVATGTMVDKQPGPKLTTWHFVSGPARDFALAISDRFQPRQAEVDGVKVTMYLLPASNVITGPEEAFQAVRDAFEVYTRRIGPYPYAEFDVVEGAVPIGGYEFSGMVALDYRLRVQDPIAHYRYLAAHEITHQWFYGLVGNDPVREPWLDESFASYLPAVYMQEAVSLAAANSYLADIQKTYGRPGAHSAPITSSALDFANWVTYRTPVYYQGAQFLHALRQKIGDDPFFTLLHRYTQQYRYRIATTGDFMRLARQVSGQDLDLLFQQWFGTSQPGGG